MSEKAASRPWSAEEDRLLTAAMARHKSSDSWKHIAELVPGRTNKACRKRWLHSLCPTIKKSSWTAEEDRKLVELHHTYGNKWSTIARFIDGRTDDACSKRFREALDPKLKKDVWSAQEDAQLLNIQKLLGCKWKKVGEEMQRGSLACRNRFRLLERRGPSKVLDVTEDASAVAGPSALSAPAVQYVPPDAYPFLAVEANVHFQDVTHSQPHTARDPPAPFQIASSSLLTALHIPPSSNQDLFWQSFLREFAEENSEPLFNQMAVPDFASPDNASDDYSAPSDAMCYSTPLSSPETTPFTHAITLQMADLNDMVSGCNDTDTFSIETSSSVGPTRSKHQPSRKRKSTHQEARLSATKPVNPYIKAYACGHPRCWPSYESTSRYCFLTSGELQDHHREHAGDEYEDKPFRCALCGTDKKWKSLNGLQYHLQISPAHFQDALSSTLQANQTNDNTNTNPFTCDRPGCTKSYRHLSGLHYHQKHAHHQRPPTQLSDIPHSIAARLKERQKQRGLS